MSDDELGMFPELPFEPIEEFKPTTTCSHCESIIAVKFQNGNLFFCTAQKGGQYGKKIKRSAPNCEKYKKGEGLIPHGDGYYGGHSSKGLTRGKTEESSA